MPKPIFRERVSGLLFAKKSHTCMAETFGLKVNLNTAPLSFSASVKIYENPE
jgi:hypothetical protein